MIDYLKWAADNPTEPTVVSEDEAECLQQSQEIVNLDALPIPWHYPQDRGRYMSASVIIAEFEGRRNMSFHRQYVKDSKHLVARLIPRHLYDMLNKARAKGEDLPIAIVNAPDPVVLLAAAMSFDHDLDELRVASALHQKIYGSPLNLVKLQNGISVPADSEYAMSAIITKYDDLEGPYVDITSTLDFERHQPLIEVQSIHHRNNPIFHALIPAESEHKTLMGLPRAPTIKTAVEKVCECIDVHLTDGGCGWLSAVVSIKVKEKGDGFRAIEAAFNGHKSMKQVVVVEGDIDVTNNVQVEWALMTRWQPDRDTLILSGEKGSSLDPSKLPDGTTGKIGFDATLPPDTDRTPYTFIR